MTLFQNGKKIGSARAPGRGGISRFGVGYNSVTLDSFYHGWIDDIRIHERVLAPTEFGPRAPIGAAVEASSTEPGR
jgi:hypothetical protein